MSIQQIAKLAGVPYSTTWRAINQVPGVAPEVAEAVRRAAEQIGYVPRSRRNGRSLTRPSPRRRGSIALLYFRNTSALSTSIIRSVQRIFIDQKLNLIFGHVREIGDLPPAVQAGEVDGILGYGQFIGSAVPPPKLLNIPTVWMMSRYDDEPDPWGDRVLPDHQAIGRLAARYLLDRGHLHLAYLNSDPTCAFLCQRGRAFMAAAEGRALSVQNLASAPHPRSEELRDQIAESLVTRLLECLPRSTGLFVPTDLGAAAVYRHLQWRGVRPGRDVEIIACDNQPEQLCLMDPPPASIDLERDTIAHLAVERLLWRIRHGTSAPSVTIVASPSLAYNTVGVSKPPGPSSFIPIALAAE